jgi:hypothetical protein
MVWIQEGAHEAHKIKDLKAPEAQKPYMSSKLRPIK